MRKEISIYIPTTEEEEELKITSTNNPDVVVLTLYNNVKIGVSLKSLNKALFEVEYFKIVNSQNIVMEVESPAPLIINGSEANNA
jgi:hypothetical protein